MNAPKLIFEDNFKKVIFKDINQKLIFEDNFKKLIFDAIIDDVPQQTGFPFTFPFIFS